MKLYYVEEKDFTKIPSLSYEEYFPKKEIAKSKFCDLLEKVAHKYGRSDLYEEQLRNEISDKGYFEITGKVNITLRVEEIKEDDYYYERYLYNLKSRFAEDKIIFKYKKSAIPSSFTPSTFAFSPMDIGRDIFRNKEAYSNLLEKLKENKWYLVSSCIWATLAYNSFYEDDFAISVIPLYSEIEVKKVDIVFQEDTVEIIVPYAIDTELLYNSIKEYYQKDDWGDFEIY